MRSITCLLVRTYLQQRMCGLVFGFLPWYEEVCLNPDVIDNMRCYCLYLGWTSKLNLATSRTLKVRTGVVE